MTIDAPTTAGRTSRGFYLAMALALAVTVFIGFAPTFYLKAFTTAPALSTLVFAHGLLFTGWIALLITQASLVAIDRTDIHMRLGVIGVGVGIAMVIVGLMTAITAARLGHIPPGAPPPLVFLAIPVFAIVEFAILFGMAIVLRSESETHKRLILLASIVITGAAIARLPLGFAGTPPGFFAISDLFILTCVIYDWRSSGRVHPAYVWGGLAIVVMQPLQLVLMGTNAWLAFAKWLTA